MDDDARIDNDDGDSGGWYDWESSKVLKKFGELSAKGWNQN